MNSTFIFRDTNMSNIISITKGFSKQEHMNYQIALTRLRENVEGEFHRAVRAQMRPVYHKGNHKIIDNFIEGAIAAAVAKFAQLTIEDFKGSDFPQLLQMFLDNLNEDGYASLTVPYVNNVVTFLFMRLLGQWVLYDLYINHESINTLAFKNHMEETGKTVEDLFG